MATASQHPGALPKKGLLLRFVRSRVGFIPGCAGCRIGDETGLGGASFASARTEIRPRTAHSQNAFVAQCLKSQTQRLRSLSYLGVSKLQGLGMLSRIETSASTGRCRQAYGVLGDSHEQLVVLQRALRIKERRIPCDVIPCSSTLYSIIYIISYYSI